MKMILSLGVAAALSAPAVGAQTGMPGPAQSSEQPRDSAGMSPPTTTSRNGNLSGGTHDASMPGMTHGTSSAMAADMMVMTNGKWMMGDRPATKAEITAHKRMMKQEKMSKPM